MTTQSEQAGVKAQTALYTLDQVEDREELKWEETQVK